VEERVTSLGAIGFVLLISLSGPLYPQNPPEQAKPYTIALDVDQVALDVSVLNKKGGFVSGLEKEHFRIYDNGRLQEIEYFAHEDVPVTIGVVVDASGSMAPKRAEVISAALAFIQASNPDDEMFLIYFNNDVSAGLEPEQKFTNKLPVLREALLRLTCVGQTALYDAVGGALDHLQEGRYDKKALLVISDGADNASRRKLNDVLEMTRRSKAVIYTISLYDEENTDRNGKILGTLSKTSGGEFFSPSSVSEIVELCRRIAKDIRNLYTISYKPSTGSRDGSYHSIKVEVRAPGQERLIVRSREGYFSAAPPAPSEDPRCQ
jgi:Ca-activated chloride channel homolog